MNRRRYCRERRNFGLERTEGNKEKFQQKVTGHKGTAGWAGLSLVVPGRALNINGSGAAYPIAHEL